MYRLTAPLYSSTLLGKSGKKLMARLKEAKVETVFLVTHRILCNEEMRSNMIEETKAAKALLEKEGFHVGAWLAPTIGYGGISSSDFDAPNRFTHVVSDKGYVCPGAYCPLDEDFVEEFSKTLGAIVDTGIDMIMFEDDYTLGGGKMFRESGCMCERHRKKLAAITGEDLDFPEMHKRIWGGKTNAYRKAFLDLQGETLLNFTRHIEALVHNKNPKARLGLSANASSFNIEGVTFAELVKATAGSEARPFVRMTGAPYWDQIPHLAANIEAIRVQCDWLKDTGAELLTEGDTYPRPRHIIPAAYLEGYDMALRAAGGSHGILKYMCEYDSLPENEPGYVDRHIKNEPHYAEIEKRFSNKEAVGLNLAEYPFSFYEQDLETDVTEETLYSYGGYLPLVSQWFAIESSVPVTYGKTGILPSLVFGENARRIPLDALKAGAILDGTAARILFERGVDVGFTSYKKRKPFPVEHFIDSDDFITTQHVEGASRYEFALKESAEILSDHPDIKGVFGNYSEHLWPTAPRVHGVYRYENADGMRFVVFPFVGETAWGKILWHKGEFRSYYRQRQLIDAVAYVGKQPLPAVCPKNPYLYIVAKKDGEGNLAVGLWNFFADEVSSPVIELDAEYAKADIYREEGRLEGKKLFIDKDIPPYGFLFVNLTKKA